MPTRRWLLLRWVRRPIESERPRKRVRLSTPRKPPVLDIGHQRDVVRYARVGHFFDLPDRVGDTTTAPAPLWWKPFGFVLIELGGLH
jgi:hypothetical protein